MALAAADFEHWAGRDAGIEKGLLPAKKDGIVGDAMAKAPADWEEQKRFGHVNDLPGQKARIVLADAGRARDDANKDAREQSDAKWFRDFEAGGKTTATSSRNFAPDASGKANSTLTGLVGKAKQKAADMASGTASGTTWGCPGSPPDTKKAPEFSAAAGIFQRICLVRKLGGSGADHQGPKDGAA